MIKFYRKTATIKAEQFDGTKQSADQLGLFKYRGGWYLETLEGSMLVSNGYWIATGVNGEHWAIADDVFKKTYAELPVIPENVAYIIKQAKKGDYKLGWVFHATYLGIWRVSVGNWIRTHSDVFARAWLDGYVVEEDK
ncbi:DUF1642 domain-containing protein [Lactiplantibacillus plantarum]|uniref:DUF1642 domain-containing protein n=1 Tax=Lactiplantibacillus plantarum TaxID=1590 RepID=UPI000DAD774C|nr:DUF1642 domain-containing protein [Lactiplantibacillus plantarum]KAF1282558.1 hypothetical protein CHF38_12245 [Lactiplantibacillus plantarum]MDY8144924.1 DUF1642 domain-containing protein [Lactiplantibacillus plantarum]RAH94341.1 hypothetical protein DAY22_12235 [Lactiplantibacillus plantarum]